jgi:hypothetical protein
MFFWMLKTAGLARDIPAAPTAAGTIFRVDGADRQAVEPAMAPFRLHGELAVGKLQAGLEAGLQRHIGACAIHPAGAAAPPCCRSRCRTA